MTCTPNRGSARRAGMAALALLAVALSLLTGCAGEREPGYYVQRLGAAKEETRRRAVEELTRRQKEAMPLIADALASNDPQMRIGCLKVLANVRRMQSVRLAGGHVEDPDPAVRQQAIKTLDQLSQVWKEKNVELLSQALQLDDPEAVRLAANALANMRYDDAWEVLDRAFQQGRGVAAVYAARLLYEEDEDPAAAELLIEKLTADDMQVRAAAMSSVYGIEKKPEAIAKAALEEVASTEELAEVGTLRRLYREESGPNRLYAARLLYGKEPTPELEQFLMSRLRTGGSEAQAAARACVYGMTPAAVEELAVEGLRDQIVRPLIQYVDSDRSDPQARLALQRVRESLVVELENILDSKRAAKILEGLGRIADRESVAELKEDVNDTRLESSWRVAATRALGIAARSDRVQPGVRRDIIRHLSEVIDREKTDNRVRIGGAIALCQLQQANGVRFLLDRLDQFEEAVAEGEKSEAELRDLTSLRISAQEALTASGNFVVSYLQDRIRRRDAGPVIIWAAAKTMGELDVAESVDRLGFYLTKKRDPGPVQREDGESQVLPIALREDGSFAQPVVLENPENSGEEAVKGWQKKLEIMEYPGYVRWTCALALGRIGGQKAADYLEEAEQMEVRFLEKLRKNRQMPEFYRRAPVINSLIRRHEDVLFYIRLAQKHQAQ